MLNAAYFGNVEAMKVLVTFNGNVDMVEAARFTHAMHIAADRGHVNILRFLAPLMKNPNEPHFVFRTPIDVAKQNGYGEFARILQSYIK